MNYWIIAAIKCIILFYNFCYNYCWIIRQSDKSYLANICMYVYIYIADFIKNLSVQFLYSEIVCFANHFLKLF